MTSDVVVTLPTGDVRVPLLVDPSPDARLTMVLAHGAGAGPDHPFLTGFAAAAASQGITVVRFAFPYVVAGRRLPGPAAHALATWETVSRAVAADAPGLPLVAAGKSYGGRMASVAASEGRLAPAALVYLGYPLHAPGRPDRPRAEHLPRVTAPQLFVSGDLDPFVDPVDDLERAVAACPDAELAWIAGARHSFETAGRRRDAGDIGAELAAPVATWLRRRLSV